MPRFLWQVTYNDEGVKGLVEQGGTGRRAAVEKFVESAGGRLEACYFAFGDSDAYVIAELPTNASAAALSLAAAAAGAVRIKTVPLLTAEEIDQASEDSIGYHPPGT
jgi:uncharacterized protein with GYD domain